MSLLLAKLFSCFCTFIKNQISYKGFGKQSPGKFHKFSNTLINLDKLFVALRFESNHLKMHFTLVLLEGFYIMKLYMIYTLKQLQHFIKNCPLLGRRGSTQGTCLACGWPRSIPSNPNSSLSPTRSDCWVQSQSGVLSTARCDPKTVSKKAVHFLLKYPNSSYLFSNLPPPTKSLFISNIHLLFSHI